MRERKFMRVGLLGVLAASTLLLGAGPASAASKWRIDSSSNPTAVPGQPHRYIVRISNVGDKPLPESLGGNSENCTPGAPPPADPSKCYTMKVTFPAGIVPEGGEAPGLFCPVDVPTNSVTCAYTGSGSVIGEFERLDPFQQTTQGRLTIRITTSVEPAVIGDTLTAEAEVSGGGGGSASTVDPTVVASELPEFGIASFDGRATANAGSAPFSQAGGHPYELTTSYEFESYNADELSFDKTTLWPIEPLKDVVVDLPAGLVGNLSRIDQCTYADLTAEPGAEFRNKCPSSSQVGVTYVRANLVDNTVVGPVPVYSMVPPTGAAARLGFIVAGTGVVLDAKVRRGDSGVSIVARNVSEGLPVQGGDLIVWGVPSADAHTFERSCPGFPPKPLDNSGKSCASGAPEIPILRLPTSCTAPGEGLEWRMSIGSWFKPASFFADGEPDFSDPDWDQATYRTHEAPGYPAAPEDWGAEQGIKGCGSVPVKAEFEAQPTTIDAETSSGLEVRVEVPNQGLVNKDGISSSDFKKAVVTLPQGVTVNPSQAEGLGVCKPGQYASTELSFFPTPGKGCPDDSKIGTVEVVTPLLDEHLFGDVFIAQQDDPSTTTPGAENPFDSLLALYVVIANPERGILVTLEGKVETDEKSGRIVTTFDDVPQQPVTSFDFKFREGARAPLVTPPTCGTYETTAEFTPWSDTSKTLKTTSSFEIVRGIGGGPCPPGAPGFKPGFAAGSLNNNAGSFSPFYLRLTRLDGEQNLTKFNSVLPPGVVAKIAGVEKCSEAAIAAAGTPNRTGRQELASPSCPAGSQIGRSLAGAGVGSVLTYVPGKIYLAGPWNGAPLSVVAITPAVAGPFDIGVVVVRQALTLDPRTAEVHVDGDKSDPIPHILEGIPLKLRDLRVYVDRDRFTINPTSCDPMQVRATLFGSALDVFSAADDAPIDLAAPYQAANCSRLGFRPALKLKLTGGTRRGGHPGLKAVVTPRPGDANIGAAVVKLPRSAFLDQAHIRTICTRVQFAADACPAGAIYGRVKAWSPLLDEPLAGPVYLRSSDNKLPDLVFDLHGIVDIEVVGRIDSIRGGIRSSFERVPDAPVSRVVLEMQGGKKGLIQNSRNLCGGKNRAAARLTGQSGKAHDFRPLVEPQCGKRKGKRSGRSAAR